MTSSDATLLERVGAGEEAALAELLARFGPSLMRYATHYLGSADDADEVLQEVFLRAHRAILRGVRPERLSGWLFRITVNRCRSYRRRWWRSVGGGEADRHLARASHPPEADDWIWRDEIAQALAELSPPLREAFLLKHVEGWSYEEMIETTGASLSALKMRVARACDQLRGRLKELRDE
ncbi:MAG: RNA polymerase sigma factor [Gemmatimonadota bacterium]